MRYMLRLHEQEPHQSACHVSSISRPCSTSRLRFDSSHSIPLALIISLHTGQAPSRKSSRRFKKHCWQYAVESIRRSSGYWHSSATLGPLPRLPLLASSQTITVSYSVWLQNSRVSMIRHMLTTAINGSKVHDICGKRSQGL